YQWGSAMKLKGPLPEVLKGNPFWMLSVLGVLFGISTTVFIGWITLTALFYGKTPADTSRLFFSGCGILGASLIYQTVYFPPPSLSFFWRFIGFVLLGFSIVAHLIRKKSEELTKPKEFIFEKYVHLVMCSIGVTVYCLSWLLALTLVHSAFWR